MRTRNSRNSLFVAAVLFAFVVAFLLYNVFWSIVKAPLIFQLTTAETEYKDFTKDYDIQSLSSVELYYLDKHGYRIALQLQGTEKFSKRQILPVEHGATDQSPQLSLLNYDVMHGEIDAERDETIDYNLNTEDATEGSLPKKRRPCSERNPTKSLVLLKTHRTASSTLANILYRYGDLNNLEFSLPKKNSFEYYWPAFFNPSFVEKRYSNSSRPSQMLVNARLHKSSMHLWKENGAFLITVLRDPVTNFESTFYSNHLDEVFGLQNFSNPLQEFLKSPQKYLTQYLLTESKIDIKLNLAVNSQMFDLGLRRVHFSDEKIINKTIEELHDVIDLVLVSEYMDESLVLLKRALCWSFTDMLYLSLKQRHVDYKDLNITHEMAKQINNWNRADMALYNHFNTTLWKRVAQQDSNFYDEVRQLKHKRKTFQKECTLSSVVDPETGEIRFKIRPNLPSFSKYLCEKLNMDEKDYIAYLKTKSKLKYQEENRYISKQFQDLENRAFNQSNALL